MTIKEQRIKEFVEEALPQCNVEDVEWMDQIDGYLRPSEIWLVECDDGRCYWVYEGDSMDLIHQGGIFETLENAIEYFESKEE